MSEIRTDHSYRNFTVSRRCMIGMTLKCIDPLQSIKPIHFKSSDRSKSSPFINLLDTALDEGSEGALLASSFSSSSSLWTHIRPFFEGLSVDEGISSGEVTAGLSNNRPGR